VNLMIVFSAANGMDFKLSRMEGSAKGTLQNIPHGFRLTMEQTPDSKGFIAAGTAMKTVITPEQKLRFRWRGGDNNQATTFGILLSVRDRKTGKHQMKVYKGGSADGPEWRKVTLGFDRHFKLTSGSFELYSLRFVLTGKYNPQLYSSIDICDVAVVDKEEASALPGDFMVVPADKQQQKKQPLPVGFQPITVFFDFDNNDFKQLLTKRNQKPVYEKTGDAGFRDLVLEHCGGLIQRVDSPAAADVIVYSRTKEGTHAQAIAQAVQRGAGLVVYGKVHDPDVAALLPADVIIKQIDGLAERDTAAQSQHPLFSGIKFNDIDFGRYLDLKPRTDVKTLLTYSDGQPLALEKGNILQYGVGIGTTLLPSCVFYDKLLLHSILWYGADNPAQALKQLSIHEQRVKRQLEAEQRRMVETVTDAAGISRQESTQYFRGMSHNNIGRFGYLIAEGLPCDNIDSALKVVDAARGVQSYTFDVANTINSSPKQVIADSAGTRNLAVTRINWIYKQYEIFSSSGTHRLSLSQVSPFVLYDFSQHQAQMTVENIADYAAYRTSAGIKLVNLADKDVLYDLQRDGRLDAPWILLFRHATTSPLMLALARNLSSIRVERSMGAVDTLIFNGGALPLGEIAVGRPWGITRIDTSGWVKALPEEVVETVTTTLDFAFNFPIACDEIYRINRIKGTTDIVNHFRYHRVKDEWNTKCSPYAVLPPLTAFAVKNNILGSCPETLSDFSMNTKFGPLLGVRGRDTIRYSLPLPDKIDPVLPGIKGVANTNFISEINACAIAACKWSCRTTPADAYNPVHPLGSLETFNIDPFGWQMGMGVMLEGYFQFGPDAKRAADERIRKRICEPMDLYRYKNFESSRVEPFSGIQYTVNFRSVYPNPVNYAPEFGTKLIFGDGNEAYAQIGWIAALMADRLGYARQIRNAWPHYKYMARYNKRINDWAFHSSSCREYGLGGWMDMLNCEYPALYYHARLAEIAGDTKEADNAIYRTAKSMVPTLVRFQFAPYLYSNQLIPANRKIAVVLGFHENEGAKYYNAPLENNRYIKHAVDLFDFSQGFPGAMSTLYRQRVLPEVQTYLAEQAIPALIDKQGHFDSLRYLTVLAQFCDKNVPLEKYADDALTKYGESLRYDRPGYNLGCELGNVLAWKYKAPRIQICRGVDLKRCSFDVKSRQLTLIFTGSLIAELVIPTPRSLNCKGVALALTHWQTKASGIILPVNVRENRFTAQY
jgi:hypothetical protein